MTTPEALLIVDMQRDFLPGGALAVPDGDAVIGPLEHAAATAPLIVASRDWHPPDHCSFVGQGGPWPTHCVAGTLGAELHPRIAGLPLVLVVDKATHANRDAYSAFDGTDLARFLQSQGVTRLVIGGVAAEYCVRASALDALTRGFAVVVLADAVRSISPDATEAALVELAEAGATIHHAPA
jgi:nicotinamidase/pyrazinamidase